MNRTIMILVCSLALITSVQASLTVYIDDYGPATDTILSVNILMGATAVDTSIADDLPDLGGVKLFSEYDPSDDTLLVISYGEVWVVSERETTLTRALERTLDDQGIPYSLVENPPGELSGWEPPADPRTDSPESTAQEPSCEPSDESISYCDDGTVEEECVCVDGVLVCERFECSVAPEADEANGTERIDETESSVEEPVVDEPGFFARIIDLLFGWMRR